MRLWLTLLLSLTLSGCITENTRNYQLKNLAKSDIDMVSDLHRNQVQQLTRELTTKLYRRNPRELAKVPGMTVEARLAQLFQPARNDENHQPLPRPTFAELNHADSIQAVRLAFDKNYRGDRVFALMAGMTGMLNASYGHRDEFFLTDELDQQKLYHSARNLEAIAWQLATRKDSGGELFLLTNGTTETGVSNLSFERLFGKLIVSQDLLANIIADGSSRTINRVVQRAASMTLLPI